MAESSRRRSGNEHGMSRGVGLIISVMIETVLVLCTKTVYSISPLNVPGWPTYFELNEGEGYTVSRLADGEERLWDVQLHGVRHVDQPDYYSSTREENNFLMPYGALVDVSVDGSRDTLFFRPYQMPRQIEGLRLYVEITELTATAGKRSVPNVEKDVRFGACAAGETWGPENAVFPIEDFRWRSSPYMNTWFSIVPKPNESGRYYHFGEDFGAIPSTFSVVSSLRGKVVSSPVPDGVSGSNTVIVQNENGFLLRYLHMDYEDLSLALISGYDVGRGEIIGKTGMTWDGRKSQTVGHHLHYDLQHSVSRFSVYPLMIESYFRMYPDAAIPVVGGYVYGVVGKTVVLDAGRSVTRPGRTINEYQWKLEDGSEHTTPVVEKVYSSPGYYAEELTITCDNGQTYRDFAYVRIYDPAVSFQPAVSGFIYYTPLRGIYPGEQVTFFKKFWNGPSVSIDFGDGSPQESVSDQQTHRYETPGLYTVTLHGKGSEPFTIKTYVVVEEDETEVKHSPTALGHALLSEVKRSNQRYDILGRKICSESVGWCGIRLISSDDGTVLKTIAPQH